MQKSLAVALGLIGLVAVVNSLPAQESPKVNVIMAVRSGDAKMPLPADGPVIEIMAVDADGSHLRDVAYIPEYPIINSPEVSPDGEWIGVDGWKHGQGLTDAHVLLIHLKSGEVSDMGRGAMPTWSPDGRWIAFSRYRGSGGPTGVLITRVNRERERLIDGDGWAITWSPDGQNVAYVKTGQLIIFDVRSGTSHEVFTRGDSPYVYLMHNPEWSPDGKRICFIGRKRDGSSEVATVSAEGDDPDLQVCGDASDFSPDIGWSKDGCLLTLPRKAADGQPGQIWAFDLEARGDPIHFRGQPVDRQNLGNDWSPDGKTLYFLSVRPLKSP